MLSVFESPQVMDAVDNAREQWRRSDDAWDALTWVLAKDPTVGQPLGESGRLRSFVFDGSRAHGMPTIDVLYEIQDDRIVVQRARFRHSMISGGSA